MSNAEYRTLIKEMPSSERPRERLEFYGPGALSNAELIAIALRTGGASGSAISLANQLLSRYGGLAGIARASVRELCGVSGVGVAKACQLIAALELGRRLLLVGDDARAQISSPSDAGNLLISTMGMEPQEQLRAVLLDTRHRVLRAPVVYVGNVNSSMVRPAEVFREAIKDNAPAIIVAHNHPSGDLTPSPEDVRVTEELVRAGKLLEIEVLDHLVIGRSSFYSLREHGMGFAEARRPR